MCRHLKTVGSGRLTAMLKTPSKPASTHETLFRYVNGHSPKTQNCLTNKEKGKGNVCVLCMICLTKEITAVVNMTDSAFRVRLVIESPCQYVCVSQKL